MKTTNQVSLEKGKKQIQLYALFRGFSGFYIHTSHGWLHFRNFRHHSCFPTKGSVGLANLVIRFHGYPHQSHPKHRRHQSLGCYNELHLHSRTFVTTGEYRYKNRDNLTFTFTHHSHFAETERTEVAPSWNETNQTPADSGKNSLADIDSEERNSGHGLLGHRLQNAVFQVGPSAGAHGPSEVRLARVWPATVLHSGQQSHSELLRDVLRARSVHYPGAHNRCPGKCRDSQGVRRGQRGRRDPRTHNPGHLQRPRLVRQFNARHGLFQSLSGEPREWR